MRACMRLGCHSDSLVVVKTSSGTEDELPQGGGFRENGMIGVWIKSHYAVHFHPFWGDHLMDTQIISAHDCELVLILETEGDCS